jgi:transcriptional regulator with XRE-family HTH domain
VKSDYAERLKNARRDLRLTQNALGERWDVDGNYIYMLESGIKSFPEKWKERVEELEGELARRTTDSNLSIAEEAVPWGGKEIEEPDFHIGLNLVLEKLTPHQLSQLIRQINTHARMTQAWKTFWIRTLNDWLEIQLAAGSEPKTVPSITKQGIVREEHADLRGVSSGVAERAKAGAAGAAEAAGLPGVATRPTSPKAASTTDNKASPTDPTDQRLGHGKDSPKKAPK